MIYHDHDPLAWTSFSLVLRASLLSKKGSQGSKHGGVVKPPYGVVIHYDLVVFSTAGSFGLVWLGLSGIVSSVLGGGLSGWWWQIALSSLHWQCEVASELVVQELPRTSNQYSLKSTAGTNRRSIAVRMGGVLLRFPFFLQRLEASKAQRCKWGAYCGTNN